MLTVAQVEEAAPVSRAVRVMTNRLAALDERVAQADSPAAKVVAGVNGVRALLRHVPPQAASSAADDLVLAVRGIYIRLINARLGASKTETKKVA